MLTLALMLVLTQVPSEETPLPEAPKVELLIEAPPEPRQLQREQHSFCSRIVPQAGFESGEVQLQCNLDRKECLVAPMRVREPEGTESTQPVQRSGCKADAPPARLDQLKQAGVRFFEARADAPDGWYRDARGRVMQANFDLTRRIWVGGGYSPFFRVGDPVGYARGRLDFGIAASFAGERVFQQLRVLEGNVWVGHETRADAAVVRYWWTVNPLHPPIYVTTFGKRPHRFDLPVSFAMAFDGCHFEVLPQKTYLTVAAVSGTMDFWHSEDLESSLRLRAGAGLVVDTLTAQVLLRPEAALEADFTLDRDGFHHLTWSVTADQQLFNRAGAGRTAAPLRVRGKLGYEAILLAINDYPLTLVLDGRGGYREDLPTAPSPWEFEAHAGLRMSFWAPARRGAPPLGEPGLAESQVARPVPVPVTAPAPEVAPNTAAQPPPAAEEQ